MFKDLRKIAKNFSSLIIAQIVYKIFAFFTYVLIARYLKVASFGQLSFAISFVGLFAVGLDLGLSELMIRDVAGRIEELSQKYISNIFCIKLMLTFISFSVIAIVGIIIATTGEIKIIILTLALCLALDSFAIFFRSIFRLFEKMEFEAVSLICEGVLKLGLIFAVLNFFSPAPLLVAFIFLLVSCITLIVTMVFSQLKFLKLRFAFDNTLVRNLLKNSLPFAVLAFFGVINFKISIVMVSYMLDDLSTAWHSVAIRFVEPILIIPVVAATALFPTIARTYRDSRETAVDLFGSSLKILFISSIVTTFILYTFAENIILFVFGSQYINSIPLFKILCFCLVPFFLKFFLERFILILNKPKVVISSYLFGTFLMIVTGVILVKLYGYVGASIAIVISEFFIVAYNFIWMKRCLIKTPSIISMKENDT